MVPLYRVSLVRDGSSRVEDRPRACNPADVARLVRGLIPDDGIEHFGVVMLDVRKRVIGTLEVSAGCLTASMVHPREVFGPAIVHKAAALIVYHNHPSGDPEPSAEDIALTRRLTGGGALLGIEVIDHVVVGSGTDAYRSLRDMGVL